MHTKSLQFYMHPIIYMCVRACMCMCMGFQESRENSVDIKIGVKTPRMPNMDDCGRFIF